MPTVSKIWRLEIRFLAFLPSPSLISVKSLLKFLIRQIELFFYNLATNLLMNDKVTVCHFPFLELTCSAFPLPQCDSFVLSLKDLERKPDEKIEQLNYLFFLIRLCCNFFFFLAWL